MLPLTQDSIMIPCIEQSVQCESLKSISRQRYSSQTVELSTSKPRGNFQYPLELL